MEREFRRGEVYWARMDNGWGSEQAAARPVVIVSSDQGNETCPTIMGAFLTTKAKIGRIYVQTDVTGNRSWIMCNQIRSLDKDRLTYIGSLSYGEIAELDAALRIALDLDYVESSNEVEKLEARIKELEAQVAKAEEEKAKVAIETIVKNDLLQKCYDTAITELVAVKMTGDIDRLTKLATVEEAPAKVEEKVEEAPAKVEINTCSAEELQRVGCNARQVKSIIDNRPYESVDDLRRVPWLTSVAFAILKNKVCCVPVAPAPKFKMKPAPNKEPKKEKVNVNEASWQEISEKTGICETTARQIVSYRIHNGPFKRKKELINVPRIGERAYKKYEAYIEV